MSSPTETVFGTRTSIFSRLFSSDGDDAFGRKACSKYYENPSHPHFGTYKIRITQPQSSRIPFPACSRMLSIDPATFQPIVALGDQGTAGLHGVDPTNLMPSGDQYAVDYKTAVGPPAVYTATAIPVAVVASTGSTVNIDQTVELEIGHDAKPSVVFDLSELTTFADSIFKNQIADTPKSAYPPYYAGTTPAAGISTTNPMFTTGDVPVPLQAVSVWGDVSTKSPLPQDYIHAPKVHVRNLSAYPVYGIVPGCKRIFDGVASQVLVKPNQVRTFEYRPDEGIWRSVRDTEA